MLYFFWGCSVLSFSAVACFGLLLSSVAWRDWDAFKPKHLDLLVGVLIVTKL